MSRSQNRFVFAVATLDISTLSFAQQNVVADPVHHKLEFENNRVRVVRANFGPEEKATAAVRVGKPLQVRFALASGALP